MNEIATTDLEKNLKNNLGQPIIIGVENTNNTEVAEIEIFDALRRAWDLPYAENGDVVVNGIILRSLMPDISYRDIIRAIATGTNFIIGYTYFKKRKGEEKGQKVEQICFQLRIYEFNGNMASKILKSDSDKNYDQNDVWGCDKPYMIDKQTSFKLQDIPAGISLHIYFFPQAKINQPYSLLPIHY